MLNHGGKLANLLIKETIDNTDLNLIDCIYNYQERHTNSFLLKEKVDREIS